MVGDPLGNAPPVTTSTLLSTLYTSPGGPGMWMAYNVGIEIVLHETIYEISIPAPSTPEEDEEKTRAAPKPCNTKWE